jgi:hypothetical protein
VAADADPLAHQELTQDSTKKLRVRHRSGRDDTRRLLAMAPVAAKQTLSRWRARRSTRVGAQC